MRFFSCSHDIKPESAVFCRDDQCRHIRRVSNHLMYYDNGINKGYFRECRVHEAKPDYLRSIIREYFGYVRHSEYSQEFEKFVFASLSSKQSIDKFFDNVGFTSEKEGTGVEIRRT